MIDILLCHAEAASGIASQIVSRLETGAEAKVWTEEVSQSFSLFDSWASGLTSTGILIVLSPDVVPPRLNRQDWETILTHIAQNRQPEIGFVLSAECPYPKLLERKNFFRWTPDSLNVLRAIERWAISLHNEEHSRSESALLPWFASREEELQWLYAHLVDSGAGHATLAGGLAGGKTALAQAFARSAAPHFRDVVWVACGESSDAFILGDLSSQLRCARPDAIPELLYEHRLLVVFDDVRRPIPLGIQARGRSSVMITAREASVATGAVLELSPFSTIHAEPPADKIQRSLWHAMALCHSCGFPEFLPVEIAGMRPESAGLAVQRLIDAGLVDRLDNEQLRMNHVSRLAAWTDPDSALLRARHARLIYDAFCAQASTRDALIKEIPAAIAYTCQEDWELAKALGIRASDFLRSRGRIAEAAEVIRQVLDQARRRNDVGAVQSFDWEISWLQSGDDQVRAPIHAPEQLTLSFSA
jgi:hypothetical protein